MDAGGRRGAEGAQSRGQFLMVWQAGRDTMARSIPLADGSARPPDRPWADRPESGDRRAAQAGGEVV